MLQESRAKELLEERFNNFYVGDLGKKARASYARLKIYTASRSVAVSGNAYDAASSKLKGFGEYLEAKPGESLLLMTDSGMKNQNPTLLELEFQPEAICVSAWAKEGLIKQRSAEKAIAACLETLGLK